MAETKDVYGSIYQKLIDAGCDMSTADQSMAFAKEKSIPKCVLSFHNTEQYCLVQCILDRSKLIAMTSLFIK